MTAGTFAQVDEQLSRAAHCPLTKGERLAARLFTGPMGTRYDAAVRYAVRPTPRNHILHVHVHAHAHDMYMCMHMCMHMCMYTHMYTYMHMYMCMCMCM